MCCVAGLPCHWVVVVEVAAVVAWSLWPWVVVVVTLGGGSGASDSGQW